MLRDMFQLLVEELVRACTGYYGDNLVTLAVYGSVGRGTPNQFSDIDLIIIARNLPDGRLNRMEQFSSIEMQLQPRLQELKLKGINTTFSPVVKTPEEVAAGSWLFLDMTDDAFICFDRGSYFQNYLDGLKSRLQELGAHKIRRGERWHWDLKPDYREGEVIDL